MTPEQVAMSAAARAVLKVLAQSKNPRTLLGRYRPSSVAYHAAYAAIETYDEVLAQERARREACAR